MLSEMHGSKFSPQLLLIKNLPGVGRGVLYSSLETLFRNNGCIISNCIFKDSSAYIKFDDHTCKYGARCIII